MGEIPLPKRTNFKNSITLINDSDEEVIQVIDMKNLETAIIGRTFEKIRVNFEFGVEDIPNIIEFLHASLPNFKRKKK